MAGGGARFTAGGAGGGGFEDIFSMFGGGSGAQNIDIDDLLRQFGGQPSPTRRGGQPGGFSFGFGGFGSQPEPRKGPDVLTNVRLGFRQAVEGDTVELTADGRTIKIGRAHV